LTTAAAIKAERHCGVDQK